MFNFNRKCNENPAYDTRVVMTEIFFQNDKNINVITVMYLLSYDPLLVISLLQTDHPDFIGDKARPMGGGSEASIEVCFEPHQVGEARGQLIVSSAVGGEYIFPLHGICLPPKAQGPFSIRAGRNVAIPFKNVFLQTTTFSFQVKKS